MRPSTIRTVPEPAPAHGPALPVLRIPLPLPANAYRLQTSPLRGFAHRGDLAIPHAVELGDTLALVPEPANPHDPYAVRVHHRDRHLGYLPRESNRIISRLLRQGAPLRAVVAWIDPAFDPRLPLTLHVIWEKPASRPARRTARRRRRS